MGKKSPFKHRRSSDWQVTTLTCICLHKLVVLLARKDTVVVLFCSQNQKFLMRKKKSYSFIVQQKTWKKVLKLGLRKLIACKTKYGSVLKTTEMCKLMTIVHFFTQFLDFESVFVSACLPPEVYKMAFLMQRLWYVFSLYAVGAK